MNEWDDKMKEQMVFRAFLWGVVLAFLSVFVILWIRSAAQAAEVPVLPEDQGQHSPLQESIPALDDRKLELLKEDIIDAREVPILNCNPKTLACTPSAMKEQEYYYAGDYTDLPVQDEGDYSFTVDDGGGHYRVYSVPFIKSDLGFRSVERATTSLMHWYEQVELPAQEPLSKVWNPWFIETVLAQETVASDNDDAVRCDSVNRSNARLTATCADAYLVNSTYVPVWSDGYYTARAFYTFDTSALDGTVTDAKLHLFNANLWNYSGTKKYYTSGSGHSSPIVAGDLHTPTYANGVESELTFADDTGTEFELPVTTSLVDLDGSTKLAVVTEADYENGANSGFNMVAFYSSRQNGTTYDPYLELTLTTGSSTPPETSSTPVTLGTTTTGYLTDSDLLFFVWGSCLFALFGFGIWYALWPLRS